MRRILSFLMLSGLWLVPCAGQAQDSTPTLAVSGGQLIDGYGGLPVQNAVVLVAGGREQIVAGTDAGSPFNVHNPLTREMQHYLEAGLTPMEIVQSATLRAAQLQGVENDLGTVTEGKYADMVIVDGDPLQDITLLQHKIVLVIKGGEVYVPDDTLDF